jgi:hypothetical protein
MQFGQETSPIDAAVEVCVTSNSEALASKRRNTSDRKYNDDLILKYIISAVQYVCHKDPYRRRRYKGKAGIVVSSLPFLFPD